MCELRGFSILQQSFGLETIEEEPDDCHSQNSRGASRSLKNGINGNNGRIASAGLQSQTNTITTYATQYSCGYDINNIARMNSTTSRKRNGNINNDLLTMPSEMNSTKFLNCFCPSSIRWLILLISFAVLSSLFANMQLFNLAILYTHGEQKQQLLLMPQELLGMSTESGNSPQSINWADENVSTELPTNNSTFASSTKSDRNKIMRSKEINATDYNDQQEYPKVNSTEGKKLKLIKEKQKREANSEKKIVEEEIIEEMRGGDDEEEFEPEQQKRESELLGQKIRRLAQRLLFSVPGMAILVAHFPCYLLVRRYGAHKMMFFALLISAIITGAFPFLMNFENPLPFILFARIQLGFCIAPAFSFLGQMASKWATIGEQHFFILVGFTSIQFGPSISWFMTVNLFQFDHSSHIQLFGIHSAISLLLSILWLIFYRDEPQKHQMVNGEELNYIVKKKPRSGRSFRLPTSIFCLLLRSTSAWACWISSFCYFFAILSLLIFYPIFFHKVLHQSLNYSLVIPFIFMFFGHFLFHICAAFSSSQSATWKMRLFNSIAFILSAMFFLGATIMPGQDELAAIRRLWFLWFCLLPLGATSLGFIKSAAITGGGPFTQYIVSHMQLAFGLAYALVPTLFFPSIIDGSLVHWRLLFLGCALLLLLGTAIFIIFGRGTPTHWAEQWADDARGDAPLLLVKFSPIHQQTGSPSTSHQ